ncbi:hypothetical protein ANCDUO_18950 [Ancylostoma duodenale]|uniref:Uncharacterized protein n=1 Tax=Ancylostoma duodenale TaxID=51022 RepID=A0A0C2C3V2_9BILA|nr:hypothetical protein ANCDUO_18950 [Ancylostoma duodenale]
MDELLSALSVDSGVAPNLGVEESSSRPPPPARRSSTITSATPTAPSIAEARMSMGSVMG